MIRGGTEVEYITIAVTFCVNNRSTYIIELIIRCGTRKLLVFYERANYPCESTPIR